MSWNVNGCDRPSETCLVPKKTGEETVAAGGRPKEDARPQRVAVSGVCVSSNAPPPLPPCLCRGRDLLVLPAARGRQHAGERLSAPPSSGRKVRVLAVVSLSQSVWGC